AFANEQEEVSFFSSSKASNDIGTVDDPDDPNATPISDYVYPLIVLATAVGFYYTRKKIVVKN
ncbi:hypothetical protein QWI17_04895, partial [Gilvimarinus sp. SDUM040013]